MNRNDCRLRPPTARQRTVLGLIYALTELAGFPPGLRELMKPLGVRSRFTVCEHIRHLALRGLITREPGKSRTVTLTLKGLACLGVANPFDRLGYELARQLGRRYIPVSALPPPALRPAVLSELE